MHPYNLIVVIPCYNEEKSLLSGRYSDFINSLSKDIMILFVDDKSTDNTYALLQKLSASNPENIFIISNAVNVGKAESIRNGMMHAFKNLSFEKIAFLDADLATPLSECIRLSEFIDNKFDIVFGSRVLRIGAEIKRDYFRYITGRVVATLISTSLKLDIYDTQCGCKIFKKAIAEEVFKQPFISKWLFDVELFFRAKKENKKNKKTNMNLLEIPLNEWVEYGDSKVSKLYFFKMFIDLYNINRQYNWRNIN